MTASSTGKLIKQLAPSLTLVEYHQIPVLSLQHPVGHALIALQGAQLLRWQPTSTQQDVLWLSDIEPFQLGNAIRGGIPICYPWFGVRKSPAHGTARLRLWHLMDYQLHDHEVRLTFALFDQHNLIEAKLDIIFDEHCQLVFTQHSTEPAQLALHTYFQVGNITQIEVQGLPTTCESNISKQTETVPSPRHIDGHVDCIYRIENAKNILVDPVFQRHIVIEHQDASEVVLWNPWQNATSSMSETGYQTMVCVETARLSKVLQQGDQMSLRLSVK